MDLMALGDEVRITVFGGHAAYPTADVGCSGYLVERDGFQLLVDPGYAVLPRLLAETSAHRVLLTHLWPRVEPAAFVTAARAGFAGPVAVAEAGLVVEL
ncbi:hypothetical protein [Plantactinospora sp. B5E13]|uniref:hypothetical protein n=1 Tax=unclassified Plantactinospora TaxID=2631981 RepID=UPI00325D61EF